MIRKKRSKKSQMSSRDVDTDATDDAATDEDEFGLDEFEQDEVIQADTEQVSKSKKVSSRSPRKQRSEVKFSRRAGPDQVVSNATAAKPERVVRLGDRSLNKKQQGQVSKWKEKFAGGAGIDEYMRGQLDQARQEFGTKAVAAGNETDSLVIGIPCPALAFEYLIANAMFPLGLVLHLNGPPNSHKSSMLYEWFRWFRLTNGGAFLLEHESKFSPDLCRSIMALDDNEVGFGLIPCHAVEDWQEKLTFLISKQQKFMDGTKSNPGPGRTMPMIFGVDSVVGKSSVETQERVAKHGYGGRAHPVEAMSITQYIKSTVHLLEGWPFTLILNNHEKLGKDDMGREQRRTGGGQGINFQESFEIAMRVVKKRIQSASWDGVVVRMRCHKNSFGPTHREIQTRVLWWEEDAEDGSGFRHRHVWDWDWSLVHTLVNLEGRYKTRLKDAGFHIEAPKRSDVDNEAWSKNLGMNGNEKKKPSWTELGKMIRENPEAVAMIRNALAIAPRPYMDGDYLKQLDVMVSKTL